MDILKLIRLPDGSIDLAKAAAATAHFLMACSFVRMQVVAGEFNETIWLVYGGFAIAHDAYNRVTAMVKENRDKKMDAGAEPAPVVATNGVTVTTEVRGTP